MIQADLELFIKSIKLHYFVVDLKKSTILQEQTFDINRSRFLDFIIFKQNKKNLKGTLQMALELDLVSPSLPSYAI